MRTIFLIILISVFCTPVIAQSDVYVDINILSKLDAGHKYPVDIVVHKEGITGFAKLELYLPVGVELFPVDNNTATFINQGQLVKYIWLELPSSKDLKLTAIINIDYRISGYKEIYGNFYCILEKNKNKVSVGVVPFQVINDDKWKNSSQNVDEFPQNTDTRKVKPENLTLSKTYRIQIAAFKHRISKNQLIEIFAQTDFIKEEIMDGMYKYTIGDFKSLEDAKIFRIQCGIYNSFIVTYENGNRMMAPVLNP
jgi:hypothetical protein